MPTPSTPTLSILMPPADHLRVVANSYDRYSAFPDASNFMARRVMAEMLTGLARDTLRTRGEVSSMVLNALGYSGWAQTLRSRYREIAARMRFCAPALAWVNSVPTARDIVETTRLSTPLDFAAQVREMAEYDGPAMERHCVPVKPLAHTYVNNYGGHRYAATTAASEVLGILNHKFWYDNNSRSPREFCGVFQQIDGNETVNRHGDNHFDLNGESIGNSDLDQVDHMLGRDKGGITDVFMGTHVYGHLLSHAVRLHGLECSNRSIIRLFGLDPDRVTLRIDPALDNAPNQKRQHPDHRVGDAVFLNNTPGPRGSSGVMWRSLWPLDLLALRGAGMKDARGKSTDLHGVLIAGTPMLLNPRSCYLLRNMRTQ